MQPKGKILTYEELATVTVGENDEQLVDVCTYDPSIIACYKKVDMIPYTGDRIFVRETVARKLAAVNKTLNKMGYRLKIVYGYRHLDIQKKYFEKQRQIIKNNQPSLSDEELDSATHNLVAVPSVAGHPTGGAVDITIVGSKGNELDMGTSIGDFNDLNKIKTLAEGLSKQQSENRQILHDNMISQEFAPFYGEWWHFSYGDREWAYFYGKSSSLYSPVFYKKEGH